MNINCLNGKVRGIRPEKKLEMEDRISSRIILLQSSNNVMGLIRGEVLIPNCVLDPIPLSVEVRWFPTLTSNTPDTSGVS